MLIENKLKGVERIYTALLARTYELIQEYNLVPESIDECTHMQNTISQLTIGQLDSIVHLGDRMKGLKLFSIDPQCNTLYLEITGLYGGMDAEGFIHT